MRDVAPQISQSLGSLVERGLAKDPAARPRNAQEFTDQLARCKHNHRPWLGITAHPDHHHCFEGGAVGAAKGISICVLRDIAGHNGFADRMSRLTDSARNLLAFLVAEPGLLGLVEVSRRTKTGRYTIRRIVEELECENYAYIDPEPEEGEPREPIRLTSPEYFDGWPFFEDLRAYATDHETIRRIIVDLDFSVLD
ncbi:hypothetical protein ACFV0C_37770 [Streptomyces sp. NPDC059568]|uniref:hypothetical protein n=1 Tax=Streptomyces sp. NPDC059568 TaxID=3346868 RepID=UPI00367B8431